MVEFTEQQEQQNNAQTPSLFVNRLLSIQTVSNALKRAQDFQEKNQIAKQSVTMVESGWKWINSLQTVQTAVNRVSTNELVRDYAQKIDQLAANGVDRVTSIDTQLVKDSTIKFVSGTVEVADQFVQKTPFAPTIQTALDVVESYLPIDEQQQASIADHHQQEKQTVVESVAPSDTNGAVHRTDTTVLFRAGRLTRRLQKQAFRQLKVQLANNNLGASSVPKAASALLSYSSATLDNAAKTAAVLLNHSMETTRNATTNAKLTVFNTASQVQQMTSDAIQSLSKAYSMLSQGEIAPRDLLIKSQLALKQFANTELEMVASFGSSVVPKLRALSDSLLTAIDDVAPASVAHALHEVIETIRRGLRLNAEKKEQQEQEQQQQQEEETQSVSKLEVKTQEPTTSPQHSNNNNNNNNNNGNGDHQQGSRRRHHNKHK